VGGLGSLGRDIVNLSRPGWQADKAATAELAEKLLKLNITTDDVTIIDPLSNSFFCGFDIEGDPTEPVKLADGKWHILGDLTCRHRTKLKRVLDELSKAIDSQSSPRIVIVTPVPRYLLAKCCSDPDHITNFADRHYITEIEKELDSVEDLLVGWGQSLTSRSDILNFRLVADDPEAGLLELRIDGEELWQLPDPVHGTVALYSGMAKLLASILSTDEESDQEGEPVQKRPRFESIVVQRQGGAAQKAPTKSTASWSTGILPPPPRGGRGQATMDIGATAPSEVVAVAATIGPLAVAGPWAVTSKWWQ
jgi:hypothetical protein